MIKQNSLWLFPENNLDHSTLCMEDGWGGWVGGGVQRYCEIVPVCESITYSPPVSQPLASDHKYYSASVH